MDRTKPPLEPKQAAGPLATERPAIQPIRQQGGRLFGVELLTSCTRSSNNQDARFVPATNHPLDWLYLDVAMLHEAAIHVMSQPRETNSEDASTSRPVPVFVNLSAPTGNSPLACNRYLGAARASGLVLPAGRLVVEISRDLTASVDELQSLIAALQERNIAVAMDGFHDSSECWRKARANWNYIKLDCARLSINAAQRALHDLTQRLYTHPSPTLIADSVDTDVVGERMFAAGAHAAQGRAYGQPRFKVSD